MDHCSGGKNKVLEWPLDLGLMNHCSSLSCCLDTIPPASEMDDPEYFSYALWDIRKGEELTENYSTVPYLEKLKWQYGACMLGPFHVSRMKTAD